MNNISLGIGITTKDRWEDLELTLSKLEENSYSKFETLVIDDGSKTPCPDSIKKRFPWVKFLDQGGLKGTIPQRNRLAHILKSDYYFSLDDDSFPVEGNISEAVDYMEKNEDVFVLGFQIIGPDGIIKNRGNIKPYPIRHYIECAALIRRKLFIQVGGYEEKLTHFAESPTTCLRAFSEGYITYAFPNMIVQHNKTPVARNNKRDTYYYMRNDSLIGLLYFPFPFSLIRPLICLNKFFNKDWNSYPDQLLSGWISSFYIAANWKSHCKRLSINQFFKMRSFILSN